MAFVLIVLALGGVAGACRDRDPLERVRALQSEDHWVESVELLRPLVDESPADERLHLEYGRALLGSGDATRAIWPLRRAAEAKNDEELAADAGVLLSMALLASANPEDAVTAATRVLDIDPESAPALFARSRALLGAKREEDALRDAADYVDRAPDDPQGRLLHLGLLVMLDRIDEAEAAIADAAEVFDGLEVERPEERARFCVLEATFVWEKGDPKGGGERIDACLEQFPGQSIVVHEAADQLDRAGEVERATQIVREALERDPEQPEYRLMLAERLRAAGDSKGAEAILREGTERLTGPGPWLALHDFYVATERYGEARRAMEHALANETDPPAALRIAYADDLILSGDLAAAEREADKIPPPGVHLVRGRILLERGRAGEALAELEEGIRLWPDNPSARWLAGQAAERIADFPRAISHYREAVRAHVGRTPAAAELAEIYAAMGVGRDAVDFALRNLDARPEDPEAALLLLRLSRQFESRPARGVALAALARMPDQVDRQIAEQARERALLEGDTAAIRWLEASNVSLDLQRLETLRAVTELELRSGRAQSAASRLEKLTRVHPDSLEILLLEGDVLEALGAPLAKRREVLERAHRLAPDDGRPAIRLAQLEAESGNVVIALALYDGVRPEASEHGDAVLAALELRRSTAGKAASTLDEKEIERRLESVLARDPRRIRAAVELERLLAARDPGSERGLALLSSAALLGGAESVSEILGRRLVERGDFAAAIPVLERAISSLPGSVSAQYWLGVAHEGLGHRAEVRKAFEASLASEGLTAEQHKHVADALARMTERTHADGGAP